MSSICSFHLFSSIFFLHVSETAFEDMDGRLCLMDLGLPALHVSYSTHWRSISLNPFCAFQGSCSTRCGSGKEGTFKEGEFEGQELNSQPRRRHAARAVALQVKAPSTSQTPWNLRDCGTSRLLWGPCLKPHCKDEIGYRLSDFVLL